MAVNKIYLETDNLIRLTGLKDVQLDDYVNDATVTMTLCKAATTEIRVLDSEVVLAFTGGSDEPAVGDVIEGNTSGAYAEVVGVGDITGTWGGGDAAGNLTLKLQEGTFQAAEMLDNVTQGIVDFATATADSTGGRSITAGAGAKTQLPINGHLLKSTDYLWIQGTVNIDGEYAIDSIDDAGLITIVKPYVAEKFTGSEKIYVGVQNGTNITLDYVTASNGDYEGILPDTLVGMIDAGWYYLFVKAIKGATKLVHRLRWNAVYYPETV